MVREPTKTKKFVTTNCFCIFQSEAKTPSDETKNFGDGMMTASMIESMTNSQIAVLESQAEAAENSQSMLAAENSETQVVITCSTPEKSSEDTSKQAGGSDSVSAPTTSDSAPAPAHSGEVVKQDTDSTFQSDSKQVVDVVSSSSVEHEVIHSKVEVTSTSENYLVDDLISGVSSVKVEEPHVNGDSPVPMDTTPTQSVDLLGTLSNVHSVNHNGVDNTAPQTTHG